MKSLLMIISIVAGRGAANPEKMAGTEYSRTAAAFAAITAQGKNAIGNRAVVPNLQRRSGRNSGSASRSKPGNGKRKQPANSVRRRTEQRAYGSGRKPCTSHQYLTTKGVQAHGARVYKEALVIPFRDVDKKLHTLQFINPFGGKIWLKDGLKRGCYFSIGKPDGSVCIVEGFATGASIAEMNSVAVAVAGDCGNLRPVAEALRAKYPDIEIFIAADDDYKTPANPGLTKAREAAAAVGGSVIIPDFGNNRPDGATDFNDYYRQEAAHEQTN